MDSETPDAPSELEIQNFFEGITPEQFARETSATQEFDAPPGPANFTTFVDGLLNGLHGALHLCAAADAAFMPVAILYRSGVCRLFEPDDDETNGQYISRLHREARAFGATRFFLAVMGSAHYNPTPEAPRGELIHQEALTWYGECREGGRPAIRQGIITLHPDGSPNRTYEGSDPEGADALFRRVLADSELR